MATLTPFEFHLRELTVIARESAGHNIDIEPRVRAFLDSYNARPTTLNGYPVIAMVPRMLRGPLSVQTLDYGRFIVLVKREHPDTPFVTAMWSPSCGDSWDCGTYLGTLADGMQSLLERAQLVAEKPHDEGSAPPTGFVRYQIEIDVSDEIDPSDLLERAQDFAGELLESIEDSDSDDDETVYSLSNTIGDRVSVKRMEG